MATAAQILTYEEWLKLPPVENGTDEVVKGELRFMPPTRQPHAEIVRRLTRTLDRQLDDRRAVVFGSNLGLMISREPLTCRSPDVVVYAREGMLVQDGLHWSPPGLIIEVLSPSENRRRQEEKLAEYAAIGVPEVWLVSPEAETVEVLRLREGKLERTAILAEGDLQPAQFPGVAVSVPAIFPQ
jgi:Uma2 family endonuclease